MTRRPSPPSAEEQARRRPPPPHARVGALEDAVHLTPGRLLAVTPIRVPVRPSPDLLGYTPGAGGALRGAASAASSLPLCVCGALARRVQSHTADLVCAEGHRYRGTRLELADAEGAESAERRRRARAGGRR